MMEFHPVANIFPMMSDEELSELAKDISGNELRVPILLYEGKILDGRNRYQACELAGVSPEYDQYEGDDPLGYVLSLNLHRRHLTASQRAALAAEIANMAHGGDRKSDQSTKTDFEITNDQAEKLPLDISQAEAAEKLGVSDKYVREAKKIQEESPEHFEKVKSGELSLQRAKRELQPEPISSNALVSQTDNLPEVKPDVGDEKDGANQCTFSEWEQMDETQRARLINDAPDTNRKFRLQTDNDSIEWARLTWNPITGCLHDCDYCYAADFATRWTNAYPNGFKPTIIPERLYAPANTKQKDLSKRKNSVDRTGWKNVFVCSMADLFGRWVPEEWIRAVLEAIEDNPQWNYLILTKFPIRMSQFKYPDNVWLGTSADRQGIVGRAEKAFGQLRDSGFDGVTWLSCEPMLERLTFKRLDLFDWLVIGGCSKTTRVEAFYPDYEWIEGLKGQAGEHNLPVYEKTNLRLRRREYPKVIHTTQPKQKATLEAQIMEPAEADREGQLLMDGLLK